MNARDLIIAQLSASPCLLCRVGVRAGDLCPPCRLAFDGYTGHGQRELESWLASLADTNN